MGQIAYFSLRMRKTALFLLPVKNLTSPSCSPTPISHNTREFWRFGHKYGTNCIFFRNVVLHGDMAYHKCWLAFGVSKNDVGKSVSQHQIKPEFRHGIRARVANNDLAKFDRSIAVIHSAMHHQCGFYSAAALHAMQSAVIPTAIPSVCPSDRLSHAGTLSRRMNIGLRGLHCEVAKTL